MTIKAKHSEGKLSVLFSRQGDIPEEVVRSVGRRLLPEVVAAMCDLLKQEIIFVSEADSSRNYKF